MSAKGFAGLKILSMVRFFLLPKMSRRLEAPVEISRREGVLRPRLSGPRAGFPAPG